MYLSNKVSSVCLLYTIHGGKLTSFRYKQTVTNWVGCTHFISPGKENLSLPHQFALLLFQHLTLHRGSANKHPPPRPPTVTHLSRRTLQRRRRAHKQNIWHTANLNLSLTHIFLPHLYSNAHSLGAGGV